MSKLWFYLLFFQSEGGIILMKKIIVLSLLLGSRCLIAGDLAEEAAAKLIKKPVLEVHCEDGDGDTYNNVDVFVSDSAARRELAIIGLRLGEEATGGRQDVLVAEKATKSDKLSRRAIRNRNSTLSYFEVAKYESPSTTVTVYQEQLLNGSLYCVINSSVRELNRQLDGAMEGYPR